MLNCTPIEYCMGNISGLSDSELSQVASAIQKEQNARKNKKRQKLINKQLPHFMTCRLNVRMNVLMAALQFIVRIVTMQYV